MWLITCARPRCDRSGAASSKQSDYVEQSAPGEIARAAIASGSVYIKQSSSMSSIPIVIFELLPVEPIVQTLLRKPAETECDPSPGRCQECSAYF